jgi:hypothetical protein
MTIYHSMMVANSVSERLDNSINSRLVRVFIQLRIVSGFPSIVFNLSSSDFGPIFENAYHQSFRQQDDLGCKQ